MQEHNFSVPFFVFLFSLLFCQFYTPVYAQVEVSFPKVDRVPLSHIPEGAIVLYDGWMMKESSIIGMNGEKISSPGYKPEKGKYINTSKIKT